MSKIQNNVLLVLLFSLYLVAKASTQTLKDSTIFTIVEEMPMFVKCIGTEENYKSQKACADRKFLSYFYQNFKFPKMDESGKMECCYFATSFIVEKNGEISNIKIVKSGGKNIDSEIIKFFKKMPSWVPGKQNGKIVRVKINWPIRINVK